MSVHVAVSTWPPGRELPWEGEEGTAAPSPQAAPARGEALTHKVAAWFQRPSIKTAGPGWHRVRGQAVGGRWLRPHQLSDFGEDLASAKISNYHPALAVRLNQNRVWSAWQSVLRDEGDSQHLLRGQCSLGAFQGPVYRDKEDRLIQRCLLELLYELRKDS